jgi:hypothetical protein
VIVEVADPPGEIDRYAGEAVIVKSATPAAIVTSRLVLWIVEPLFAATSNVNLPVEAPGPAEIIRVDDTPLPVGGVTGVGSV